MFRFSRAAAAALLVVGLGCQVEKTPDDGAAAAAAAAPGGDGQLIAGTPDGDLNEWLTEVKAGLEQVLTSLEADRSQAHKRVLDLYVTRQEYIEMYYGPNGRMQPEPVLAEAVKLNETRFHELMRMTGAVPPAAPDSVRAAVTSLQQQLAIVESNASRSARRVRSLR